MQLPKSWASTLFLPKTAFPARALVDGPNYLEKCTDKLYQWQSRTRSPTKLFVLQDGPPFANGPLHLGHALNKILKDITCRFELSLGKKVDFIPGWDCHGLPIEIKAIEKLRAEQTDGKTLLGHGAINPLDIRKAARTLAHDAFLAQRKSFREWGIAADWDNAWKTMDSDFELRQMDVFSSMVKKGLISRKFKPVYWSPSSLTALAEAELEYRDEHESTAAYIAYPVRIVRQQQVIEARAVIWTTTPWTLPANRAIAVRSDQEYCIVKTSKFGRLILAKSILGEANQFLDNELEIISSLPGKDLIGQKYTDCLFGSGEYDRQILDASFVSSTTGTGLVHIAPGHGMDDYELCQHHGIDAFSPVDDAGRFSAPVTESRSDWLEGKAVLHEGNAAVLSLFSANGLLVKQHQFRHKYPYDWRTKQPVIIRATEQWFADVGHIREAALKSLESVKFTPKTGNERLKSFVKNRSEWCISRQRAWGVPIPALYSKADGKAIMTDDSVEHIISVIKDRGIDAWWSDHEDDPRWIAPTLSIDCGPDGFRRGKDTMDVWFDSGTSWTLMRKLGESQTCPTADVVLEGTDQHRGWFQSSLLTYVSQQPASESNTSSPVAPFKALITHGFVLDSAGLKMSKSIGNVISPDEIMAGTLLPKKQKKRPDAMGPDALRLWVASSDYTSDVKVNTAVLQSIHMTLAKYRVTFRFILGVLKDFNGPFETLPETLGSPHRLALLQLREAFSKVHDSYGKREYNRAISDINRYITKDLSAFYMEIVKDALYADRGDVRWQAQFTLLIIYHCLQTMLGPVTPVLIEETWDYTPDYIKANFPHPLVSTWAQHRDRLDKFDSPQLAHDMPILSKARAAVSGAQEQARSRKHMGSSLECFATLQIEKSGRGIGIADECFKRHITDLASILVVSKVDVFVGEPPHLGFWSIEWMFSEEFDVEDTKVIAYVYKPLLAKCIRCWRYLAPIEAEADVALCGRCETVLGELDISRGNDAPIH